MPGRPVGGDDKVWALDAATGRPRWAGLVEFTGDESAVTAPVIANRVVYASSHPTGLSRWAGPTAGG